MITLINGPCKQMTTKKFEWRRKLRYQKQNETSSALLVVSILRYDSFRNRVKPYLDNPERRYLRLYSVCNISSATFQLIESEGISLRKFETRVAQLRSYWHRQNENDSVVSTCLRQIE